MTSRHPVPPRARPAGFSLVELLAVLAIVGMLAVAGAPYLRASLAEAQVLGAGRTFKAAFRRAYSIAIRTGAYTAIRFETRADGEYYAIYRDGNGNGVRAAEIRSGIDEQIEPPRRLDGGLSGVRVAINPGTPAIPPERGTLDTADPIRFGNSNMLSFSPLGSATPGTFYLAGRWAQAAVRVTPGSARVRLMTCRGRQWTERS